MTLQATQSPNTVQTITKVTVVRHGESGANRRGAYAGHTPTRLTRVGVAQATQTARSLAAQEVSAVLSGPLPRARQTAKVIAAACGVSPETFTALDEIALGPWNGLTRAEIAARYPAEWSIWRERPEDLEMPGFEPLDQASARIDAALRDVHRTRRGTRVVVVTHEALIRLAALRSLDLPISAYRRLRAMPCSISEFAVCDDRLKLISLNSTTHLFEGSA